MFDIKLDKPVPYLAIAREPIILKQFTEVQPRR